VSARIARGGGGRGGQRPRSKSTGSRSVNTRRAKSPSMLDSVGLSGSAGRRIGGWTFGILLILAAVAAMLAFRLPQLAGVELAERIGAAGFTMRRVEIKGAEHVSRLDIYNIAFDQPSMAMPLVDLETTRARLLRFGWVKEARVHRRLPDTLVIDVVERVPAAIWQNNRQLSLIDAEGVVLEPVRVDAMPELPLVIGPGANRHLATLDGLLRDAPHLRPQVAGASWVGGRRWDIRFQTGEVLALPEGPAETARAVRNFARMDQQTQLLGRGFARFDMRSPGRFIVRVSREPGSIVPTIAPGDPSAPAQDLSRTI
jgi:cell division protein FtsQ